jgi:hypothetical protein
MTSSPSRRATLAVVCPRKEPPIGAPAGAHRRNDRGAQIWVVCAFGVGASLDASEVVPGRVRSCTSRRSARQVQAVGANPQHE